MKQVFYLIFLTLIGFYACNSSSNFKEEVIKSGNLEITMSSNMLKMQPYLNLTSFKPKEIKFKLLRVTNAVENVNAVNSNFNKCYIEALLVFDKATFSKLLEQYKQSDFTDPNFNRDQFAFDWLDEEINEELVNSPQNYHGHPDFFFDMNNNAQIWMLKDKLLLIKPMN